MHSLLDELLQPLLQDAVASDPEEDRFLCQPVREAGELVWAYIGPKDKEPPFQHYAFMDGPEAHRVVLRINTAANWLQLYEGGTALRENRPFSVK